MWKDILKRETVDEMLDQFGLKATAESILEELAQEMSLGEEDLDGVARQFERAGFKTALEGRELSLSKNGKLTGTIVFDENLEVEAALFTDEEAGNIVDLER